MKRPQCIIVTGRQGSGKTTLAKELGQRLWMPVICRDEIKEGYVTTFGVKHDLLPPETNRIVTDSFFDIVNRYLEAKISVVIEAAFQHRVWEPRLPPILAAADVKMVLATAQIAVAARRAIERGVANPDREFYHGDHRVAHFRKTGEDLPPAAYESPNFEVPTIEVATDKGYDPPVDEIVRWLQGHDADIERST